jgi:hypothetical protein
MGGLAASRLIHDERIPGLRAYAGIYPLCDLSSVHEGFAASIEETYGEEVEDALAALSPAPLTAEVPVLFWASPDDTLVAKERNADVCAAQVTEQGGDAEVIETEGEHGDSSNFDAARLLEFFAGVGG